MSSSQPRSATTGDQSIQAGQYTFPYHYTPSTGSRLRLSRHWPYAASYVAALNLVANLLRPLAEAEGKAWRHIDIGCGDGALIHHLGQMQGFDRKQIQGVDIDARAIAWARIFNPTTTFTCGSLENAGLDGAGLGFSSGSLIEVLEHVPPETLPDFVGAAARLLRPGSLMVVTVPCVEKPVTSKHYQHFSFDSIRGVLAAHFDDIRIVGFERSDSITRLINRLRSNRFFCLDAPGLNAVLVARYQRTHASQRGCGRILLTARRAVRLASGKLDA